MSKVILTDEPNPWTTKGSRIVYDNKWIRVCEDSVIDPNGNDTIYGVVSPKVVAVGVVPLDENNNTWLVGQHRYPHEKYSWEIVEGGCPKGTDPLTSAKRELREEAGITAQEWKHFLTFHTSNCFTNEVAHVWVARQLSFGNPQPDADEKLQVIKIPFSEVVDYVMSGRITDSITMCAVLKLNMLLQKGRM
jgi:ADP-ribose pyrophosphatase